MYKVDKTGAFVTAALGNGDGDISTIGLFVGSLIGLKVGAKLEIIGRRVVGLNGACVSGSDVGV